MIQGARILQLLVEARLDFVVIGGVAALIHGSTLVTRDIDVCLRFDEKNLKGLAEALRQTNPKHRITPQKVPLEITDSNWAALKNLYLETDWGVLDCLSEVKGLGAFDQVAEVSIIKNFPFGSFRVLSLEALIRAKEAVGRPQDLAAVRQLRLIQSKPQSS